MESRVSKRDFDMELRTVEKDSHTRSGPRISVAIDGPAGAGKSTLARKVAEQLGYLYIDTGAMYRAATWVALQQRADLTDEDLIVGLVEQASIELAPPDGSSQGKIRVLVNGADVTFIVRSRIITRFVSPVSAIPGVRKILVDKQKGIAQRGGVVMDGRDIGTVVLPHAEVKVFLTASPEVRAARRLKDMQQMGQTADLDAIVQDIKQRDHMDSTRATSPLKQAEDAVLIDTDHYSIDQVVALVLGLCQSRLNAQTV